MDIRTEVPAPMRRACGHTLRPPAGILRLVVSMTCFGRTGAMDLVYRLIDLLEGLVRLVSIGMEA